MSDFNKQVISDLAKKYTYENFDFINKSVEDLYVAYQQNFDNLENVIGKQNSEESKSWLGKT